MPGSIRRAVSFGTSMRRMARTLDGFYQPILA
jgi:hypothetical protein